MTNKVADIVKVTVNVANTKITRTGFGVPLITGALKHKIFTDVDITTFLDIIDAKDTEKK